MNVVGDIQKRLKFGLSTDQEDRFRQANFGKDIAQARIFIILILLPFVALLVNDYGFFGPSRMFYGILALRLVICCIHHPVPQKPARTSGLPLLRPG